MRPLLKPALRRVWRDPQTVQIGLDPASAVLLTGVDQSVSRFLDSLDGTRELSCTLLHARELGLGEHRGQELIDLLLSAGLLEDAACERGAWARLPLSERDRLAPDLAALSLTARGLDGGLRALTRRRSAAVVVEGAGRVGAAVACLLAACAVGYVIVRDAGVVGPADIGPGGLAGDAVGARREEAVRAAMHRVAPETAAELPAGCRQPDIAVLAPVAALTPALADDWLRAGVPHVPVSVRESVGVVGPLVLPGESCCLRCADLHRTDRDPAWPRLVAQLASERSGVSPCQTALGTLLASQAVLQVLAWLDGTATPPTVGASLETSLPDGRTRRRSWPVHPGCGCHWRLAG